MYPEAVQAESMNPAVSWLANTIARWMPRLYRPVDVMVDIGSCMRARLDKHRHAARKATLVPWALAEPEAGLPVNQAVRRSMFGDDVTLGILYSGSLGMAHEYEGFLKLARLLRTRAPGIVFAFSSRGNRMDEMLSELTPEDSNIRILPFASQEELADRLNAADIHLLSLKSHWAGIVVPSKFFGSLAAGKPILYSGAGNSCIAEWLRDFDLGLVLTPQNTAEMADKLIEYSQDPDILNQWKQRAYRIYHEQFSLEIVVNGWHALLAEELGIDPMPTGQS